MSVSALYNEWAYASCLSGMNVVNTVQMLVLVTHYATQIKLAMLSASV